MPDEIAERVDRLRRVRAVAGERTREVRRCGLQILLGGLALEG